jgi:hypothetical protein
MQYMRGKCGFWQSTTPAASVEHNFSESVSEAVISITWQPRPRHREPANVPEDLSAELWVTWELKVKLG